MSTTVTSARPPATGHGAFRVLVVHAPNPDDRGRAVVLGERALPIGRSSDPHDALFLHDPEISREHARIEPMGEPFRFALRDLGSRNGTFLNGERIETQELSEGDVIRVGTHLLLYEYLDVSAVDFLLSSPAVRKSTLLGESHRMRALRERVATVAPQREPVLVLGETGTGKELVATELHLQSKRQGRFVAVNCAALPKDLAESELFGHARGAFSGADQRRDGLFGEADGGTLFLDEIGDMPLELQVKILRAIESGEVRRVGESTAHRVDSRIVAATNVALREAVDAGRFRADLYARLSSHLVAVPPLRARRDDVPLLVRHFLREADRRTEPTTNAWEALLCYDWPFNVRELKQVVAGAGTLAGSELDLEHLPPELTDVFEPRRPEGIGSRRSFVDLLEIPRHKAPDEAQLRRVMRYFDGNVAQVGGFFGKDRKQVHRWLERFGLDPDDFRGRS